MPNSNRRLKIGTRGSPLAIIQAEQVRDAIIATFTTFKDRIDIVPIKTSGDKTQETSGQFSGKGEFTKEIEEALLAGSVDIAMHSMKDVPEHQPKGLAIVACLPRANPYDAFISPHAKSLLDLPKGARVGTSSLRRQALVLAARPDLKVVPLRGNVDTRLRKIMAGEADATILAAAGLERLGIKDKITAIMSVDEMLPAAGQGAIAVEIRSDDHALITVMQSINHDPTWIEVMAERAMLSVLDGSCRTPIGALARLSGDQLTLTGLVARPNGTSVIRHQQSGPATEAEALGKAVGQHIKQQMPLDFFAECA